MQDPTSIVTGHEQLTAIFGSWPSFHDAEVVSVRLERDGRDLWESPALYATVHVFAGRLNEASSTGVEFYNHTLVTFRFNQVFDLEFSGFNHQNAIFDLIIATSPGGPDERPIHVNFEASFGVALRFNCQSMEILDVEKTLPANSVYAESVTPQLRGITKPRC